MTRHLFAVIPRDGFFRDRAEVYSAHPTEEAAIKAAKRFQANIPGNPPNQSTAMVIRSEEGFAKGDVVYRDTIRRQYPVVW